MIFVIPLYFIDLSFAAQTNAASLGCSFSSNWTNIDSLLLCFIDEYRPLKKYANSLYSLWRSDQLLSSGASSTLYGGDPSGNNEIISSSKLILRISRNAGDVLSWRYLTFSALVSSFPAEVSTSDILSLFDIVKFLYDFNQMCASFVN